MSREIKFRGKRKDSGKWVYGWFVKVGVSYILPFNKTLATDFIEVIPETVGQFTGLCDKNDKEIYEGDIITHTETSPHGGWWDGIVSWQSEGSMGWCVEPLPKDKGRGRYGMNYCFVLEIIGNTHESPKLLES